MLSFEVMISSTLVLGALLLLLNSPIQTHTHLQDFYEFLELSDYAAVLSQTPCDFSKLNLNKNFCYTCKLSGSTQTHYSNTACASIHKNKKTTVHLPVYTNSKIQKMSVSKY